MINFEDEILKYEALPLLNDSSDGVNEDSSKEEDIVDLLQEILNKTRQ